MEKSSSQKFGGLGELFAQYTEFKASHLKNSSLKEFKSIAAHLERLPTQSLNECPLIIGWIEDNLSAGVARRTFKQLNACCNWAVRRGAIEVNPFEGMANHVRAPKSEKKINPFSDRERDLILEGFKDSHYLNYVRFLFATGCRPSEAAGLQAKHLYFQENYILFAEPVIDGHREKTTKNDSIRRFPLSGALREMLRAIAPADPEALIFVSTIGSPINLNKFRENHWVPVLRNQGIPYRPPYTARHSFITSCIRQAVPIPTIAQWVGNSPAILLKHYAGFVEVPLPEFDF